MKREILSQNVFPQFSTKSIVMVDCLGNASTSWTVFTNSCNMTYEYFNAEPLKLEFENETMRSRFEAELRHDTILLKRDIQPDILAALYGESSDWHFARCYWTPAYVILCLGNKKCLEQKFPTDEDLRSATSIDLEDCKDGFVELCIPVHSMDMEAEDALEYAVNIATEAGAYQSLQAFTFAKHSLIEAKPRSDAEKPELYYLRYVAQRPIRYEQDWIKEEEG